MISTLLATAVKMMATYVAEVSLSNTVKNRFIRLAIAVTFGLALGTWWYLCLLAAQGN